MEQWEFGPGKKIFQMVLISAFANAHDEAMCI